MSNVQIVQGPSTSGLTREAATANIKKHPSFPKNASVTLEEVDGRWVAAIVASEPPNFEKSDDESKAPKEDKPDSNNPFSGAPDDSSSDDSSSDDSSSDDAPKLDESAGPEDPHADKGEKGGELGEVKDLLNTICQALGIDPAGHDPHGLDPAADAGAGDPLAPDAPGSEGGPADLPPAPDDLGAGTPSAPGGAKHIVHEHALKPGETPPGGTPLGAPSFSSVNKLAADHPWAEQVNAGATEFWVEERIGAANLAEAKAELDEFARQAGLRVKQISQSNDAEGHRTASAIIGR